VAVARKPVHARSAFLDALLGGLAAAGFDGVPRPLGYDGEGNQLFSFIPGWVPAISPYALTDAQLISAADLIRRYHDAAARLPLCGGAETVVHSDLGAHNTVFRGDRAVALIDFDADSVPGGRLDDFAQGVWSFADLTERAVPVGEQARKTRLLCDAYPGMTPSLVVDSLVARFERARDQHRANGLRGGVEVFEGLLAFMAAHGDTIRRG
jgi:aminoglycoside phosphotransferase (APT) family kinase protein